MPCPLPRWTRTGASVGCYPVPLGPSPLFRRVGVHDFTFEACSGFTHVTACRIAQPPKGGLCHEASTRPVARSSRSSATRVYRQLPGWILPPLVNRAVGAHRIRWASVTGLLLSIPFERLISVFFVPSVFWVTAQPTPFCAID